MDIFQNYIWEIIASYRCNNIPLTKVINVLKEYNVTKHNDTTIKDIKLNAKNSIASYENVENNIVDIFYENLHFHLKNCENEKVFQIFIKKSDAEWIVKKNENDYDFSNPLTESVEIFYWFDIATMHNFRCVHDHYLSGSWNKYVAQKINEFIKIVNELTVESRISNAYKDYK